MEYARRVLRRPPSSLLALALSSGLVTGASVGCTCVEPPNRVPDTGLPADPRPPASTAPSSRIPLEVHELGWLEARPGAPSVEVRSFITFRLPRATMFTGDVTASLAGGAVVEAWPEARDDHGRAMWPRLRFGPCALLHPNSETTLHAAPCLATDGHCEAETMRGFESDDVACVGVNSAVGHFAFFRGAGEGLALPYSIEADGTVTARPSGHAGEPLYRVEVIDGRATVARLVTPGPGDHARLDAAEVLAADAVLPAFVRDLVGAGLTEGEATAFSRGAGPRLFGIGDTTGSEPPALPRRAAVYVIQGRNGSALPTLRIRPEPEPWVRVYAVRVTLE